MNTTPNPRIDQWYDRSSRSWITTLRDEDGFEAESNYDGTRADAAASRRQFEQRLAAEADVTERPHEHRAFAPDNCPSCGTDANIGGRR